MVKFSVHFRSFTCNFTQVKVKKVGIPFFSNLKTVNLKIFADHEGIYTWIQNHDQSTELWKYLFLKLIVKSFQRLCNGQLDLDILFVKLTAQIGYWIWKIPSAHCVLGVGDFMQCLFLFVTSYKVLLLQSSFRFA